MRTFYFSVLNQIKFSVLNQIKTLLSQLTFVHAIKLILAAACRKAFDPRMLPSYSQFGEDRVIEAFFAGKTAGFYVDVGCNEPIAYSNTWKLYQKGWSGICIDANPELIDKFARCRPRDIALTQVVSNTETVVDFYFSNDSHLISGIGKKQQGHWQRDASNANIVAAKTNTLNAVLSLHNAPSQIDLLNIDVEGHELEVLQSIDFKKFACSLIVVEIHDLDLQDCASNATYAYLVTHAYSLLSYASPSAFFVKQN
jgi:FkbM family methyltransferase